MPIAKKQSSKPLSKKTLAIVTTILLVIVATVVILEATNTTHLFHTAPAVSGKIPIVTSPTKSSTPTKTGSQSSTTTPTAPSTTATNPKGSSAGGNSSASSTGAPLQTPFGSFVSNHSPNLGGSPAPSSEQSICNTTPGASCTMTFTNDSGVVKTLPAQSADSNGTTTWLWDVKTAGFTAGTWHITATSTLDGQTKTATDQLPLKVQP